MDISKCSVLVESDLKQFGIQEDGAPFIGEIYYVAVENQRGDRWTHHAIFSGVQVETDEDNYKVFLDIREDAKLRVKKLADAIQLAGHINLMNWHEARPIFGSEAYQDYGMHDDIMLEKTEG